MYTGTFHVFSEDIFAIALFYFRFFIFVKIEIRIQKGGIRGSEGQRKKRISRTPGTID
jgi:hypothetical protein